MNELTTQHLAAARRRLLAQQMAARYAAGVSQMELAHDHNVSQGFVSSLLKEAGVVRRAKSRWEGIDWTQSDREIAKAKGCTRQRVGQIRKQVSNGR